MATIRGDQPNNKRSMGAANSALKQKHDPPSKSVPTSSLPVRIPPGTAAYKHQHIFMNHCEFRQSPIHGYGVFAIQDIQPGTLIMQEEALWVVDIATAIKSTFSKDADYYEPRRNIIASYYKSNSGEENEEERVRLQQDILTLCGGFNADDIFQGDQLADMRTLSEHLREILILNGVAESCDGQADYVAVFRASSRLNHSCTPNSERMRSKLNDGSVWCMVYATSPIKKGEEIFVNYVDLLTRSLPRQYMFQSRWKFTCECKLCTRPQKEVEVSDLRRENIEKAMSMMRDAQKKHAAPKSEKQGDVAYMNHLKQCDKSTLGEAGWEMLERLAAAEGISDLKLFNSIMHAADAARRLKKLSLEIKLTDRLMAVCRTYSISPEMDRSVEARREELRWTAKQVAVLAHLQELANKAG